MSYCHLCASYSPSTPHTKGLSPRPLPLATVPDVQYPPLYTPAPPLDLT